MGPSDKCVCLQTRRCLYQLCHSVSEAGRCNICGNRLNAHHDRASTSEFHSPELGHNAARDVLVNIVRSSVLVTAVGRAVSPQLAAVVLDTITGVDERRGAVAGSVDTDTAAGLTLDCCDLLVVEEWRSAGVVAVAVVAREGEEIDDTAGAAAKEAR